MTKLVITVAPTGSLPMKSKTPHVPITPKEIVECALRCEAVGAAVVHVHVRDPETQAPSPRYDLFQEVVEGLRGRSRLILQISTGGRAGMSYEERSQRLALCPEMASLTTGSVNFPDAVYINSPSLIEKLAADMLRYRIKPEMEIFDTSMIANALDLAARGLARPPLHFNFVMGLKGAIPATAENLMHLKSSLPADATWTVSGIGPAQLPMNVLGIVLGGHVRVGLEDNIYYRKGILASNEQLVERVVRIARELGREVASPDEARAILGLTEPLSVVS